MPKFKIEISKLYQVLIWFCIVDFLAIGSLLTVNSILSNGLILFLISIMFIGFTWPFVRLFLLNITITDKVINLNVAKHKSCSIPISTITLIRFKNKNDYIPRGNPVLSKNVFAIEYMSKKRKRDMLYFSISKQDSECIIRLLVKYGCKYEVNNPQLYK